MTDEASFKRELVRQCRQRGWYARRHEDRFAVGALDLAILVRGFPQTLYAEGKVVPHQAFAPTPRQYEEGRRYIAAGGLCALIGWDPSTKQMFVSEWAQEAKKASSFTAEGDYAEVLEAWLRGH